ncbi:MAG: class I tRNA ligase family protein, partial [Candidatus Altiarchaeales archaeon]|nr:class I tRNA ligase family protein [Candidatus Altiarchaeales archaeon]
MTKVLSRKYNRREIEDRWHRKWREEKVYSFNPDSQKEAYSIDTPPPFTSGTLHMGHIYNHVWIDIAARYKRMRGYEVYFPQGFDCHGLPTELRVEKEKGVRKEDRERFIEECVKWTQGAVERMKSQFDAVGYSCDWNHTYKTMDDTYKALVQRTLLDFYEKGLLYREKHPVLWCPRCETALAKAEVGHVERDGKLYHIDLDSEGHKLTIATTRPEMMPACVAVFVHPEDKRYKKFVGKKAKLPIFNREVPILADDEVDMEFGTGVVYLCTFGDEQDIRWQRKYRLPVIEAIDKRGRLT